MKRKLLLLLVATILFSSIFAQKTKQITGFAITAPQKGQTGWKEVRLVDITTGDELRPIYKSSDEIEILNARTGKPVVKKEIKANTALAKKVVNLDFELDKKDAASNAHVYTIDDGKNLQELKLDAEKIATLKQKTLTKIVVVNKEMRDKLQVQTDKPFATNSAACAYDKKHERLYYTPMGINQLRYIDLKSKTSKIYYFEDEPFGAVTGLGDAGNQIPRMVFASDGNGYALSNNANHLIRFTTDKNAAITDLGALTDDPANASFSVRNPAGYGGDMIADASGNLYLITGNRNVFKISIASKVATYQGTIKGLPQGFTTNGAMVEEGSKVIVCSSQSTVGYFRFDLVTMQAEKVSTNESVFNASDLANGNLAFEKKKKEKKQPQVIEEPIKQETDVAVQRQNVQQEVLLRNNISVYPNPVTTGVFKLAFNDQPEGRYQVQFMDISGKVISTKNVMIQNKMQVEEFRLPGFITAGNYLVKVISETNKISIVEKITVE
ncbi:MAG TPA: T9SS type A sorting domain-containing protein [Chitinophagaceae bacterium]|jgi:hypothetical protein|nr:T9SS type A sorting domain-containing protein [Chitinophagaceae bacterium]